MVISIVGLHVAETYISLNILLTTIKCLSMTLIHLLSLVIHVIIPVPILCDADV